MTTDRVDLEFVMQTDASVLDKAIGFGNTVLETKPVPKPGTLTPATKVLTTEVVELKMRPGGEAIEKMETHSPAKLTFQPNRPGDRRRELTGERMSMTYTGESILETFQATAATTVTHPLKPGNPPLKTWSKMLEARFDPITGEMQRLEQWEDFRYSEGPREGTAVKAILDSPKNLITLERKARVWDLEGSTSADVIRVNQMNGMYEAEGHVMSSRKSEKKQKSGGLLGGDQPVQAMASKMTTTDNNQLIRYTGKAVLWQGANRVSADLIEIDRKENSLRAEGNVETQLTEGEGARRVTTFVKSQYLIYTGSDRTAHYTGGALMTRPGMQVKSLELRAVLAEDDSQSSLDRATADGKAEIVQNSDGRTRTGVAEHVDYLVAEEKVTLRGGNPSMTDSVKGVTRGEELTYFAADDRLLVNGVRERPAASRLRRK
jgi:lipopolysaccharide export system protein LptA